MSMPRYGWGEPKSEARVATRGDYSAAAIALTAGGIGLILGALAVSMMSGPSAIPHKPPAETTGTTTSLSAEVPAPGKNEIVTVPDCDQQTWPYIAQQCLTENEAARRKVRVITTDKITPPVVSAIEQETTEAPHLDHSEAHKHPPAPKTGTLAAVENVPAAPAPTPLVTEAPKAPETKGAPAIVRLAPVAPSVVPVEQPPAPASVAAPLRLAPTPPIAATSEQQSQAATNARPPPAAARDARIKRIPEANLRRAPVREDYDEVDYSPRSRVVERWTERDYLLPSRESSERRRVIIIRREDQHPFGSIFGSLR